MRSWLPAAIWLFIARSPRDAAPPEKSGPRFARPDDIEFSGARGHLNGRGPEPSRLGSTSVRGRGGGSPTISRDFSPPGRCARISVFIDRPGRGSSPRSRAVSSVRPASARRRWRKSWRASSGQLPRAPRVRSSSRGWGSWRHNSRSRTARRAVYRRYSPPAIRRWRRFFIRRWRTPARPYDWHRACGEVGEDRRARVHADLVGATIRAAGSSPRPLRDRFGIPIRLNFYTTEELQGIVARSAQGESALPRRRRRERGRDRVRADAAASLALLAAGAGISPWSRERATVTRALADPRSALLDVDAIGL